MRGVFETIWVLGRTIYRKKPLYRKLDLFCTISYITISILPYNLEMKKLLPPSWRSHIWGCRPSHQFWQCKDCQSVDRCPSLDGRPGVERWLWERSSGEQGGVDGKYEGQSKKTNVATSSQLCIHAMCAVRHINSKLSAANFAVRVICSRNILLHRVSYEWDLEYKSIRI